MKDKRNNDLTNEEKISLAYFKHENGQKVSYDEFVLMLSTNDELWFIYKDSEYQIYYDRDGLPSMYTTQYSGKSKVYEHNDAFLNLNELLSNFKIDGKTIKDVWNDVEF